MSTFLTLTRIRFNLLRMDRLISRFNRHFDAGRFDEAGIVLGRLEAVRLATDDLFRRVEPEGRPA